MSAAGELAIFGFADLISNVAVVETPSGGDDKLRRSPHKGHDKKRATLKRDEEAKLLADIRAIYRELTGYESTQAQALTIVAPELKQTGESQEARDTFERKRAEAMNERISSLQTLGVESEIALRLLYQQLKELREQDDERVIAIILAQIL
jgi:hypothetical protein